MEEMRVYISNLGKYNEGEAVGGWFTPPVEYEELQERISLNDEYKEYAIHDYELLFEIYEYISLEELNRLCELGEELVDSKDDIICHSGCDNMTDVAYNYIEETAGYFVLTACMEILYRPLFMERTDKSKRLKSYTGYGRWIYAINDFQLPFPITFTKMVWFVLVLFDCIWTSDTVVVD